MLGVSGAANALPIQWTMASGGNGHWYDVVTFNGTWDDANSDVQSLSYNGANGYLATLTSVAENDFVWSNFPYHGYFLGGFQTNKDLEPGGNWAWVTGEAWNYTNWTTAGVGIVDEPNNSAGDEDRLQFDWWFGEGTWNDLHNNSASFPHNIDLNPPGGTGGYLVEYEAAPVPEPATMLLFGIGIVGLAGSKLRRRKA